METLTDVTPYLPSHLQQGDYVAMTFFLTTIAMTAGAIFFFFQFFLAPSRMKNSILIAGMIMAIASLNYFYMRDYWVETRISPTEFRYFDWLLTVPLIMTEMFLLQRQFGAPKRKLFIMITGSVWMLFFGYVGEALDRENAFTYGLIATLGAIIAFYEAGTGIRYMVKQPSRQLRNGYITLFVFMILFWNIYPLGYLTIPGNLLSGVWEPEVIDIIYNIGDIINKVIFSMIYFLMIIHPSESYQQEVYGGSFQVNSDKEKEWSTIYQSAAISGNFNKPEYPAKTENPTNEGSRPPLSDNPYHDPYRSTGYTDTSNL